MPPTIQVINYEHNDTRLEMHRARHSELQPKVRPEHLAYVAVPLLPAVLAGRCANGYERDQGRVVHAVPASQHKPDDIGAYARSLCGKTHGARSAGWSPRPQLQVNCPRCLKKLEDLK